MWYGLTNSRLITRLNNKSLRLKKKFNLQTRINCLPIFYNINYAKKIFIFNLPATWHSILIKNKTNHVLYLFSDIYYFKFNIWSLFTWIHFNIYTNSWLLSHNFSNVFFNLYWSWLKRCFWSCSRTFFKKLKFKGKGYYIFKSIRNTLAFRFNYGHRIFLYMPVIRVKFLSKSSILLFGINYNNINFHAKEIKDLRPFNIFTAKGVRFSRQIIYRKTGKVAN